VNHSEWAVFATYASGFEADLAMALLEAADIPAIRDNNDTVGIFGPGFQGPTARGITVRVPAAALEAAHEAVHLGPALSLVTDDHGAGLSRRRRRRMLLVGGWLAGPVLLFVLPWILSHLLPQRSCGIDCGVRAHPWRDLAFTGATLFAILFGPGIITTVWWRRALRHDVT
jgi:hypothetical protein